CSAGGGVRLGWFGRHDGRPLGARSGRSVSPGSAQAERMEFFATHGRFWLPQLQKRVVNGSLTFDEDGIRLDLGDPLRAPQVRADGIVRGSPEPAAMFIGKREGADIG